MNIVFDLLLVAILGFCGWQGYKKGILAAIVSVLFILISIYAANLLANAYSYEFISMFQPFVSGYVDSVQAEAYDEVVPMDYRELSVEDLIKVDESMEETLAMQIYTNLGIHESKAGRLTERHLEERAEYGKTFNRTLVDIVSELFCYLLLFVIAFLLIYILFTVISNVIHLSFKLPGLKLVDEIGGSVFGVVQGVLLCFMLGWFLGYLGMALPDNLIESTYVLRFCVSTNPVTAFLGL